MSDLPADNPYAKFKPAQAAPQSDNPYAKFQAAAPAAAAPKPETSIADQIWGMAGTTPGRFAKGVAEGAMGAGVPEGKGSEFEGGRAGGVGRVLGTAGRSIAESLWNTVKGPSQAMSGELQPGPEMEEKARGMAMMMAGSGFRPGMRPAPPPLEPPPPGQLMLPPPRIGVAGQPATPTGQVGTPGAFRAGLEAGGRTLGEAPPTSMVPGGALSPWREGMEAGGRTLGEAPPGAPIAERLGLGGQPRVLPPGPQPGMLPPGPTSTMTHPSATPVGMPPPIVTPPPAPPVRPVPPPNPQADIATTNLYRNAVRPGGLKPSKANNRLFEAQNKDIATGIDTIIENQPNLRLTGRDGTPLPPGSTVPTTMKQFNEAIEQSEETLFQQWDPMTRRTGERGMHIDLAPVVSELRDLARNPKVADVDLSMPATMERYADAYERRGSYTPLETQAVIKEINRKYESGEVSKSVLEPIARILRKQLDETITKAEGPGWQRLRDSYGALRSMDRDVTRAVERLARKPNSGLAQLGDLISSSEFIHGLISLNPAALGRAIGAKGGTELHRFMNDPNRMIERMFKDRIAARTPRPPPRNTLLSLSDRAAAVLQPAQSPPGSLSGLSAIDRSGRRRTSEFEINPPPGPR